MTSAPTGINLILIDIDGTLVGSHAHIPKGVWAALQRLHDLGKHIGVCTGRPNYGMAIDYAKDVSANAWHIFQNGAVVSKVTGETLYSTPFSSDIFRSLVSISRDLDLPLEAYTTVGLYSEISSAISKQHQHHIQIQPVMIDLLTLGDTILRGQFVIHDSNWEDLKSQLDKIQGISLGTGKSPDVPGGLFVSVTASGTSKLGAAQYLAQHLGLTLGTTMMVGDTDGDLELIAACGFGVAIGNATENLKKAAKIVVGHVDDGGLIEALNMIT